MTALAGRVETKPRSREGTWVAVLFGVTSFVAASLVFVVQPLVARTMLPVLGGSASVWNSSMVTFQLLLLAGYLLAHLGVTRLSGALHPPVAVAFAVLATIALPVGLRDGWRPPGAEPALWTVVAVAAGVGLPFLALACVSPTLQRWYSMVRPDVDPYVLYSAGNTGSFVGLLAYPLIIERSSGISWQRSWWSASYLLFIVLFAACAFLAWRAARSPGVPLASSATGSADGARESVGDHRVSPQEFWRWVGMAAGPSLLLLGVTRYLATDVAAIPLLWVVPLSLYLLTFVIVFSGRGLRLVEGAERVGLLLAAAVLLSLTTRVTGTFGLVLHLVLFSTLTLAAHGRLAARRPPVQSLTTFYLAMSIGGAVGGLLGGLVAPIAFPGIYEYPLGIVACVVWLIPRLALDGKARTVAMVLTGGFLVAALAMRLTTSEVDLDASVSGLQIMLGLAVLGAFMWSRKGWHLALSMALVAAVAVAVPDPQQLVAKRTYYGVTRVLETVDGSHVMLSGTTVHGQQDPTQPGVSQSYYTEGGPLWDAFHAFADDDDLSVGVIGLGAGVMSAWLEPGQKLTYYEIDPAVISIASDPSLFSYIDDSDGVVEIVEGDGRLLIGEPERKAGHDLVYVDAFSSDAIPVHLVTREALAVYSESLTEGGVVVFHLSNRHFDLPPVVAALAQDAGLSALTRTGRGNVEDSPMTRVVVVGAPEDLEGLALMTDWSPIESTVSVWTDEKADVLGSFISF